MVGYCLPPVAPAARGSHRASRSHGWVVCEVDLSLFGEAHVLGTAPAKGGKLEGQGPFHL